MQESMLKFLTIIYGLTGVIGVVAYWPTIKDLHYHKKPSANTASYLFWTATSVITVLYSMFVLPDLMFFLASMANLLAVLIVLLLSIRLEKKE